MQVVHQGVLISGGAIYTFNRAVAVFGSSATTTIIALLPAMAWLIAIRLLARDPPPIEYVATAILIGGGVPAVSRPNEPEPIGPERRVT